MSGRKSRRDAGVSCLHQAAAGLTLNKTKREQTETGRRNRGKVQIRQCRGEEWTESKVLKMSRVQAREQQNTVKQLKARFKKGQVICLFTDDFLNL